MGDFADLRLDRPAAPAPDPAPEPNRRPARVVAAILILLLVAAAFAFYWSRRPQDSAPSTRVRSERVVPRTLPTEKPADVAVPPLDESDAVVRGLVSELSKHPLVTAWLATGGLIRNFTVVVVNIAEHHSPAAHLGRVKPRDPFVAASAGGKTSIDPASYRRYDAYADAFAAIDARGAARLYATLKPRITEAYRDLGYPQGDFDAALKGAIVELLGTPVVDGRIPLTRPSVMFAYEDPALEALSPAQRQLLRMGPRNVRLVQQKLREIAPYLGVDLEVPHDGLMQ